MNLLADLDVKDTVLLIRALYANTQLAKACGLEIAHANAVMLEHFHLVFALDPDDARKGLVDLIEDFRLTLKALPNATSPTVDTVSP